MASTTDPNESKNKDRPLHESADSVPSVKNLEADIFSRYLTSNKTVKIYVGPGRKVWFLNEDLICDRVPFFKGAFKSGFKEGKSKAMELPGDSTEAFGYLVDWVYNSNMHQMPRKICRAAVEVPDSVYTPAHELQWLQVWVLADKLNVPELARLALRTHAICLSRCVMTISPEAVAFACENTADDSAVRKYLVEEVVETLFGSDTFISDIGVAAAADASFDQKVMEAIRSHLIMPLDAECAYTFCPLHNARRKNASENW